MPKIIPINDLKNMSEISEICHETNEPLFVTKEGYGDMVIMSIDCYEKMLTKDNIEKEDSAIVSGDPIDNMRGKYEI